MPTKIEKQRKKRREQYLRRLEEANTATISAPPSKKPRCEEFLVGREGVSLTPLLYYHSILKKYRLHEVEIVEMDSKKNNGTTVKKESLLPISRIRIIMKSSPDTENIGQDSLFLVARSTELFVKYLTHKAYEMHKREKQKVLDYPSLADAVQTMESMAFLKEIMPRKITVKEYKEKLQHLESDSDGEDSS